MRYVDVLNENAVQKTVIDNSIEKYIICIAIKGIENVMD